MLSLRVHYTTAIQYVIITRPVPMVSTFIPPIELSDNHALDFIKRCPQDIFQLHDSLSFYTTVLRHNYQNGYDLRIFFQEKLSVELPVLRATKRVKLFFINANMPEFASLHAKLQQANSQLNFFHFYRETNTFSTGLENEVSSPEEFIQTLVDRQGTLTDLLACGMHEITPSVEVQYKNFNTYRYFLPTTAHAHAQLYNLTLC